MTIAELPFPPQGFEGEKGTPTNWDAAYKDFWAETGWDTDSTDLAIIVAWFDQRRADTNSKEGRR